CKEICEQTAIKLTEQNVGKLFVSNIKSSTLMVHAHLRGGADNSGKLVAQVKKIAKTLAKKHGKQFVIVDGSPGIGCPVISSLSGASYVVLVTEPTLSGFHDLKRVHSLVKKFHLPAAVIINKADLNRDVYQQITAWIKQEDIAFLADLPYDEAFTEAMISAKTIVEYGDSVSSSTLRNCWSQLKTLIYKEQN
ncbi:MAG: hypothetical protein U1C33_02135, partial [Candidatus Cloacimonadaceae bacterium]|nr:hypothetical protein [Candidatus Cloacimonadaceae bacterium]